MTKNLAPIAKHKFWGAGKRKSDGNANRQERIILHNGFRLASSGPTVHPLTPPPTSSDRATPPRLRC